MTGETTTLYRPVGQAELDLIAASGWRAFPPRLPHQPIFYPALHEGYAWKNAEYDDLVAKAAGMADKAAREKAYQQAEVILMNEMSRIPIWHGQSYFVTKPNVQGIYHPAILGAVPRGKYVSITK